MARSGGALGLGRASFSDDAEALRRSASEIVSMNSLEELRRKEMNLYQQMISRSNSMNSAITKAAKQGRLSRSTDGLARSASDPILRATYGSHSQQSECLHELEELDKLMSTLQQRKKRFDELGDLRNHQLAIQAAGCAKKRSVKDFEQWFALHGRPSAGSRWNEWSSGRVRRRQK
mmetsp:Transcript_108000/g.187464  ORF Transcript_108000/g.187464 Transcript_108000/m.187464 type:complete len:176 (-) Transcript_108000:18-545(-)